MTELLLMSGGLDSALYLDMLLQQGRYVDLLFIDCGQCESKIKKEREAVDKIAAFYREKYKDAERGGVGSIVEPRSKFRYGGAQLTLAQTPPWLFGALELIKDYENMHVGYVLGDSICKKMPEIVSIWNMLVSTFVDINKRHNGRLPEFHAWLLTYPKEEILAEYERRRLYDVYDLTWTCELPLKSAKNENHILPCGKCVPCQTHRAALFKYSLTRDSTMSGRGPEFGQSYIDKRAYPETGRYYADFIYPRYDTKDPWKTKWAEKFPGIFHKPEEPYQYTLDFHWFVPVGIKEDPHGDISSRPNDTVDDHRPAGTTDTVASVSPPDADAVPVPCPEGCHPSRSIDQKPPHEWTGGNTYSGDYG